MRYSIKDTMMGAINVCPTSLVAVLPGWKAPTYETSTCVAMKSAAMALPLSTDESVNLIIANEIAAISAIIIGILVPFSMRLLKAKKMMPVRATTKIEYKVVALPVSAGAQF